MLMKPRTRRKGYCALGLLVVGILMSIYADDGRTNTTMSAAAATSHVSADAS
jgi:hypothetical protein